MKPVVMRMAVVIGVLVLALGADAGPSPISVELENESVVVLRIRLEPHETMPMHDVTPRVVVWLTDAHLRDTSGDGATRELRRRAGQVEWVPAQRHAGENLGDAPIQFVAIVPRTAGHGH